MLNKNIYLNGIMMLKLLFFRLKCVTQQFEAFQNISSRGTGKGKAWIPPPPNKTNKELIY